MSIRTRNLETIPLRWKFAALGLLATLAVLLPLGFFRQIAKLEDQEFSLHEQPQYLAFMQGGEMFAIAPA